MFRQILSDASKLVNELMCLSLFGNSDELLYNYTNLIRAIISILKFVLATNTAVNGRSTTVATNNIITLHYLYINKKRKRYDFLYYKYNTYKNKFVT